MKFDGSFRGSQRADYEQFAEFLGMNKRQPRREENANINQSTCNDKIQCSHQEKPLAMVYPVKQEFCGLYDVEIALLNGTIFEELNKPFYKTGCSGKMKEGCL